MRSTTPQRDATNEDPLPANIELELREVVARLMEDHGSGRVINVLLRLGLEVACDEWGPYPNGHSRDESRQKTRDSGAVVA
jgi:hypothetical protein